MIHAEAMQVGCLGTSRSEAGASLPDRLSRLAAAAASDFLADGASSVDALRA